MRRLLYGRPLTRSNVRPLGCSQRTIPVKAGGGDFEINEIQSKILRILKETGGLEPRVLSERPQLRPSDLEREIAALRHMEKVRGELRDGKKVVILW